MGCKKLGEIFRIAHRLKYGNQYMAFATYSKVNTEGASRY